MQEAYARQKHSRSEALVATHVFADGHRLHVGAHTVGVAVAGIVMWRTRSLTWCVLTAAVVTAVLRLI